MPHYGYQIMDGAERCSVGRWLDLTRDYVRDVVDDGQVPILVGGTGMYIRAAMEGISPLPDIEPEYRDQATEMHQMMGGAMGFAPRLPNVILFWRSVCMMGIPNV